MAASVPLLRVEKLLSTSATVFRISRSQAALIAVAPVLTAGGWAMLLISSSTRRLAFWLLRENRPVELATFAVLLLAGAQAIRLALRLRQTSHWGSVFFALLAVGLLFVAGEESAWGQWFIGFDTPDALEKVNVQEEFTLHNIEGLHGHSEVWRIVFGLGGLVGLALGRFERFRFIAVSPLLSLWFAVILAHSFADLWNDYSPFSDMLAIGDAIDLVLTRSSELVELIVAGAGFFYIWLTARRS